jgi:opacity protein-like surface antigen
MAAGYTLRILNGASSDTRNTDLRLSYAYRPNDSQWVWFDRADYITQSTQGATSSLDGTKLVNNLNVNYMPSRRTQIAMQYGAKYVRDIIDNTDYKGYTDLIGTEIRHDLTARWDIGMFGSVMRSHNSGVSSYALGASVGFKLVDNMWVSSGYNMRGMNDRDFANASYRAQGPYITLRMKVDQDTFGLNEGKVITRPIAAE